MNLSFSFHVSVLRGLVSYTSILGFSEAPNQTSLVSTWSAFLLDLYQTLLVGEFRRATVQPSHSKVSMDRNPHYDASSGEAISTQPTG